MADAPNTSEYLLVSGDVADLPNSRTISANSISSNLQFLDSGPGGTLELVPTLKLQSLANLTTAGILCFDGTQTINPRRLTSSNTITITNPAGVNGNPVLEVIGETTKQFVSVSANGLSVSGTRANLNFIAGLNTVITTTDNSAQNRVDITISASSGPSSNQSNLLTSTVSGNSFNLATLSSGLLKQTVLGLVSTPSIAVPDVDYLSPTTNLLQFQSLTAAEGQLIVSSANTWSTLAPGPVGYVATMTGANTIGWAPAVSGVNATYLCQTGLNLPAQGINLGSGDAKLGIGKTTPQHPLDLVLSSGSYSVSNLFPIPPGINQTSDLSNFGANGASIIATTIGAPSYFLARSAGNGTTPIEQGEILGGFGAIGYDSATYKVSGADGYSGGLIFTAAEDFGLTSKGTRALLRLVPLGSNSLSTSVTFNPDLSVDFAGETNHTGLSTFNDGFNVDSSSTATIKNGSTLFVENGGTVSIEGSLIVTGGGIAGFDSISVENGTVTEPAIKFNNADNYGIYLGGTNSQLNFTAGNTTTPVLSLRTSDVIFASGTTVNFTGTTVVGLPTTITGPIRIADGTVTLPAYSFTNETGYGMYLDNTNNKLNFTAGNGLFPVLSLDTLSATVTGNLSIPGFGALLSITGNDSAIRAANGTAIIPAYSFGNATNFGMFLASTNDQLNFTAGAVTQLSIRTTGTTLSNNLIIAGTNTTIKTLIGSVTAPAYSFTAAGGYGMYLAGSNNQLNFTAGNPTTPILSLLTATATVTGNLTIAGTNSLLTVSATGTSAIRNAPGSVTAPSYSFTGTGASAYGMYLVSNNTLNFSAGNATTPILSLVTATATLTGILSIAGTGNAIRTIDGTATIPTYSFANKTGYGMYLNNTNSQLNFTAGNASTPVLSLLTAGATVNGTLDVTGTATFNGGTPSGPTQAATFNGATTFASGTTVTFTGATVVGLSTTITGPVRIADGLVTSPAYSFIDATNYGMYLGGTNNELNFSAGNGTTPVLSLLTAGATVNGNLTVTGTSSVSGIATFGTFVRVPVGSASSVTAPQYSFAGTTNYGMYLVGTDLNFTAGNSVTPVLRLRTGGALVTGTLDVTGAVALSSTLSVTGGTTLGGTNFNNGFTAGGTNQTYTFANTSTLQMAAGSTLAFVPSSNITGTTSISGSGVNFVTNTTGSNNFNISGTGTTNISTALNVTGGTTFNNGFLAQGTNQTYTFANTSTLSMAAGSKLTFAPTSNVTGTVSISNSGVNFVTSASSNDFNVSGAGVANISSALNITGGATFKGGFTLTGDTPQTYTLANTSTLSLASGSTLSLVSGSTLQGTTALGTGGFTINTTSTNNITVGGLGLVSINTPLFQVYDVGTNNSSFFQNVTNNAGVSIQNLRGILQNIKNGTAFESFMNNAALNGGGGIQIRTVTGPSTVTPVTLIMGSGRSTTTAGTTISAVNALDILGRINFQGTDTDFRDGAYIQARASENWTTTAHGSYYEILTIPNGTTTPIVALNIANDQSATFSKNINCTGGISITGTNTSTIPINISGAGQSSGVFQQVTLDYSAVNTRATTTRTFYGGTAIGGYTQITRATRGTSGSPQTTQSGDVLNDFYGVGYNSSGSGWYGGAGIQFVANTNYSSAGVAGANINFNTTASTTSVSSTKMVLNGDGILLIGFTAPDSGRTEKLQINGTTGYNNAGSSIWQNTSDARIKTNIAEIENGLDIVKKLKPSTFNYTEQYIEHVKESNPSYPITRDKVLYGFIAQDIEKVVPSCVITTQGVIEDIENIKDLNIHNLNIILFKAVKELAQQVDTLVTLNDDLTTRVAALEAANEPAVPPASTPESTPTDDADTSESPLSDDADTSESPSSDNAIAPGGE